MEKWEQNRKEETTEARKILRWNRRIIKDVPRKYQYIRNYLFNETGTFTNLGETLIKILQYLGKLKICTEKGAFIFTLDNRQLTYKGREKTTESVTNRHMNLLCAMGLFTKREQDSLFNATVINMNFFLAWNKKAAPFKRFMNCYSFTKYDKTELERIEERSRRLWEAGITAGNFGYDRLALAGCEDLAMEAMPSHSRNTPEKKKRLYADFISALNDLILSQGYATRNQIKTRTGMSNYNFDRLIRLFSKDINAEYDYHRPNQQEKDRFVLTQTKFIYTEKGGERVGRGGTGSVPFKDYLEIFNEWREERLKTKDYKIYYWGTQSGLSDGQYEISEEELRSVQPCYCEIGEGTFSKFRNDLFKKCPYFFVSKSGLVFRVEKQTPPKRRGGKGARVHLKMPSKYPDHTTNGVVFYRLRYPCGGKKIYPEMLVFIIFYDILSLSQNDFSKAIKDILVEKGIEGYEKIGSHHKLEGYEYLSENDDQSIENRFSMIRHNLQITQILTKPQHDAITNMPSFPISSSDYGYMDGVNYILETIEKDPEKKRKYLDKYGSIEKLREILEQKKDENLTKDAYDKGWEIYREKLVNRANKEKFLNYVNKHGNSYTGNPGEIIMITKSEEETGEMMFFGKEDIKNE